MEEKTDTDGIRKSSKWRGFIIGGVVMTLVVGLAIASLQVLTPKGWSKDIRFDDGRMAMRVQFKSEPSTLDAGTQTLSAKVKDIAGFPMQVGHVHFTVTKDGQTLVEGLEGEPVGKFGAVGQGFYRASAQLPSPGSYTVDLAVQHNQSRFDSSWSFEVR
jgi:hypothetical protein